MKTIYFKFWLDNLERIWIQAFSMTGPNQSAQIWIKNSDWYV